MYKQPRKKSRFHTELIVFHKYKTYFNFNRNYFRKKAVEEIISVNV
jgi:hypothetical protein